LNTKIVAAKAGGNNKEWQGDENGGKKPTHTERSKDFGRKGGAWHIGVKVQPCHARSFSSFRYVFSCIS
jgi:hypothetical protein